MIITPGAMEFGLEFVNPLTLACPLTYNDVILANSANVLFHPLNETIGTISEELQGNKDGTYIGGVTLNQPGPCTDNQGSVDFNGTDAFMRGSDFLIVDVDSITIEAWVFMDSSPVARNTIVQIGDRQIGDVASFISVFVEASGVITVLLGNNVDNIEVSGGSTLSLNQWHHIVVTRVGSGIQQNFTDSIGIFINGVDEGVTLSGSHGVLDSSFFDVGTRERDAGPNEAFFDGRIAKAAFYNSVLASTEIQANFNACNSIFVCPIEYGLDFSSILVNPPIVVTPTPVEIGLDFVDPVVTNVINLIPAALEYGLEFVDPLVTQGSISITPNSIEYGLDLVNISIAISGGGELITPSALEIELDFTSASVILGSLNVNPGVFEYGIDFSTIGVSLGDLFIIPSFIEYGLNFIDPVTTLVGNINFTPNPLEIGLEFIDPSVTVSTPGTRRGCC